MSSGHFIKKLRKLDFNMLNKVAMIVLCRPDFIFRRNIPTDAIMLLVGVFPMVCGAYLQRNEQSIWFSQVKRLYSDYFHLAFLRHCQNLTENIRQDIFFAF